VSNKNGLWIASRPWVSYIQERMVADARVAVAIMSGAQCPVLAPHGADRGQGVGRMVVVIMVIYH
jgi:hypothetical protein